MADVKHIGKYEIVEQIGRGGFATVYKARDVVLDRIVALKVLHPYWSTDPGFSERFRQEARVAARLRHPNIVTIHETGEIEDQLYIAMEYLPGRPLQALLETKGPLTLKQALPILVQFAKAEEIEGSDECGRSWYEDEYPPHLVILDGFWIDQTEVTNAQFAIFLIPPIYCYKLVR